MTYKIKDAPNEACARKAVDAIHLFAETYPERKGREQSVAYRFQGYVVNVYRTSTMFVANFQD
jgi:hypothetical protein